MATIAGYIEKIKYRNEENGYSVLTVSSDGGEFTLVGTFQDIHEGEWIEATGALKLHPTYGEQMSVSSYVMKAPEGTKSVEKYLSSGAIKGVGEKLAQRIVKKFKADTLRIMEEEPEQLTQVKGVSEKLAMSIAEQILEKKELRDAMIFLQNYGVGMALAVKIYKEYGPALYSVIRQNPYRLAEDIPSVGFKIADEIAAKVGVQVNSQYRIQSGIEYVLMRASAQGDTYLPFDLLEERCSQLLGIAPNFMEDLLLGMQMEKRIVVKYGKGKEKPDIYLSRMYYTELSIAKMLYDLNIESKEDVKKIEKSVMQIEKKENLVLDELQKKAVIEVAKSGFLVIAGGPGTGKTTTINTIIQYFLSKGMEILLAAPTGRAAKRMTEATGEEARTIHRLLEIEGMPKEDEKENQLGMHFEKNEDNPLDADVIIIDEVSMVDIHLMCALLKAVSVGTRLVLVGDVNQLPSVGPGNVLRDIIDSKKFKVVQLEKIYRQSRESDIIVNAHRMIDGGTIDLEKRSRDFLFIRRPDPEAIIAAMLTLIKEKLPNYVQEDAMNIQVLAPMRKGPLGIARLNQILQNHLNPPSLQKKEHEFFGICYREGDKVMQIKNNYQLEWETRDAYGHPLEKGMGVYNGDLGIIREINEYAELIYVEFDEGKIAEYAFGEIDQLELAYAITIHKSQGSEYPAVIIPMFSGPKMLMTRNLIYTAVTRARKCVTLVGMPEYFFEMVENTAELKRYCGLKERIEEIGSKEDRH